LNELRRAVFHVYVRVAERTVYGGCDHTRFAARWPQDARQLYQHDDLGLAVPRVRLQTQHRHLQ
jgi:hypothetical protein